MKVSSDSVGKMSRTRVWAAALPFALAATGAFGGVVGTLPEPTVVDGKNVYTLGTSTSTADPTRENAEANYDYIDWASLSVPAGSVVKLNGAVVLDALPADLTYDWSACTRLAYVGESFATAGQKLTVPETATALFYTSTVTKSEDGTSFTLSSDKDSTIQADVELNGKFLAGDGYGPNFYGAVTGSGKISVANFGTPINFYGPLVFDGHIELNSVQFGQNIRIYSTEAESSIAKVSMDFRTSNQYLLGSTTAQYLWFNPQNEGGNVLTIGELATNGGVGGNLDSFLSSETGKARRGGSQLIVYGNNTVKISSRSSSGYGYRALGLFADTGWDYKVGATTLPAFDKGLGNVEIGDHGNFDSLYYVSPMMNVMFVGTHGPYYGTKLTCEYRAETHVVNQAEYLDFSGITNDMGDDAISAHGASPANLPKKILAKQNRQSRFFVHVYDSEWTMPFDFGAEDVNPARCETNCRLADIAAKGTVYVRNDTTAAHAAYPSEWTEYPVITTYAGGAPTNEKGESVFNDWTVVPIGKWGQVQIEKVVKDTGLYLRMRRENAFHIIIR